MMQFPPQLADSGERQPETASSIARGVARGQELHNSPLAGCQPGKPSRKINPESRLVIHRRVMVFDQCRTPFALQVVVVETLDMKTFPPLSVLR